MICIKDADDDLLNLFPGVKGNEFSLVTFHLKENSQVTVCGFGIPFTNHQDPQMGRSFDGNLPVNEHINVVDILEARSFNFFVNTSSCVLHAILYLEDSPHPRYPYGTSHSWNELKYKNQFESIKSADAFPEAYCFGNDNDHLTAVSQSVVQDAFWLQVARDQIAQNRQPAYFVKASGAANGGIEIRYLIFLHEGIPDTFKDAWRRLTKEARLKVELYDCYEDLEPAARWDCDIVSHPESIRALGTHSIDRQKDLVLAVRLPVQGAKTSIRIAMKTFLGRSLANHSLKKGREYWNCAALRFGSQLEDCERRINSVCQFRPNATTSNPGACGMLEANDMPSEERACKVAQIEDTMDLHRALVRGNGFYDWMTRPGTDIVDSMKAVSLQSQPTLRALPTENFLDTVDPKFADALIEELLPEDRNRFRQYLSDRPLSLGLITAAPGYGKTSIISVAAIAMHAKFGRILCSGPTNVAVSNFADRIYRIAASTCTRYNQGKAPDDVSRKRRQLVVRAYKDSDEVAAIAFLLQHPQDGDLAVQKNRPLSFSKWKLDLSLAFWVLAVLRSRSVRQLDPDDCLGLHNLRRKIDESKGMEKIRAVAMGQISWQEYISSGPDTAGKIRCILQELFPLIDMLCTTPAMTVNCRPYARWKADKAMGVAIDEAAAMHRADLYTVWGNTLLPCFLGGDPQQLPPAVMTEREKDSEGNLRNRFASTGKISALESFQAMGWPTFRMRTQLRMARGLFDAVSRTIYDMAPRYHDSCDINSKKFAAGRILEAYITCAYPSVTPSVQGTLSPFFIHCEGTKVSVNPATGSKKSVDQVRIALDFANDLVEDTGVDASQIIVLTPYSANVELIQELIKQPRYEALSDIGRPSTIDGYQGQERDIVIVVMGTSAKSGPGFTSNKQRLNVLLTRQRCGLVIVGDINATKTMGQAKVNRFGSRPSPLQEIYSAVSRAGRVVRVNVQEEGY
ncbi:P-loop containing nucleoside triphosphate hydrolase protein [Annulohypoxylon truncatum]|uniref:P-loop containing nucleoside triphosphate hydrolase protein n=1 Tax=Annulohypoxylon truncatum TaxID=327061 RepID=UPI0020073C69|nr:P-loop containing nucleoside triphosphate hydrolase protein [Annulohypoxylon truncatum]KAI1213533.1 P-loop containing nucleoside triphosphate hydrolase protein [Annulohypoxylon truncatum]